MAFNLADALAAAGVNLDTGRPMEIERVSIDLIVPDEKNFYELSELEALAASIATVGLQQPLLVRPMQGDESQVIITSGHRRHAALKMLIEQDGREDLRDVPCIIAPADENPHLTQLKLIMANSTARKLSSADQAKQAEQIEELLYQLKEDGMEFPGRMRDHVAEACRISTGKLARLRVIQKKLIPPLREEWERGELTDEKAHNLANASEDIQQAAFQEIQDRRAGNPTKAAPGTPFYGTAHTIGAEAAEAAEKREAERIKNQVDRAELFIKNMTHSVMLWQFLTKANCRMDLVGLIKGECKRHSGYWSKELTYSFESNCVRVGKIGQTVVEYTHTEFADALLLAAARLYIRNLDLDKIIQAPASPSLWQTGTPKKIGTYVCATLLRGIESPIYTQKKWTGKAWDKMTPGENVTHWTEGVK